MWRDWQVLFVCGEFDRSPGGVCVEGLTVTFSVHNLIGN